MKRERLTFEMEAELKDLAGGLGARGGPVDWQFAAAAREKSVRSAAGSEPAATRGLARHEHLDGNLNSRTRGGPHAGRPGAANSG